MPKSPRQSDTAFAIVLFTDMVGSTAIASELGDRRWKVLQAKHHSVIRAQLRQHGGREIDTAGDGFFATFSEGEAAIRCACAIRDAVMEIGLQVRCGLNVGQVEMNDGKPTGAAVVAAARIMSKAGDSEVLVSNVLRELIPGSKIEFVDAGMHELKGLDGSWHLFRVVAVDGPPLASTPPVEELTARRTSTADSTMADASSTSRTKKLLAGAAALLILATGISFLRHDNAGASTITPNSIGVLDLESGEVTETIPLEGRPGSVAASADAVWVTNPDVGTVTRIDPSEQEFRGSIEVGENPTGIAVGGGAVWVVNSGGPSVSRISPAADSVVDTIAVGNGPAGIAFGEGSVWVTNRFDGTISRIDPDGAKAVKTIPVGLNPRGIVVGFGSVWVALAGSNTVVRVDPDTNSVIRPIGVGNAPGSMAVSQDPDALWVVNSLDNTVMRISPDTNTVVDTIEVGKGPAEIAVVEGIVWVANEADGTLSRIEPGQTPVRTMTIGSVPQGLASVDGNLWVSVRGTATSHRGGTLRLVSWEARPDSLDPAGVYDNWGSLLVHLMGDGLVAFEPVGGTSSAVVPDLATSLPTPTEGGRTYVFELRPGIRYSNGEVVVAGDFRRALERGFPLSLGVYQSLFGGLLGADACGSEPGTCDLSRGIVTDDESGTITFHLADPDPDFLYKLAQGRAYPVPPGTPEELQRGAGVPGTGPYMLEAPVADKRVVLVRNPYFREWSPAAQPEGYVDRIEWGWKVYENWEDELAAIDAGEADLALTLYRWGGLDDVFVQFAAQVRADPVPSSYFLMLDTDSPPFDDVDVRRAVSLAVDRALIAATFPGGGVPTCQQIPPNFPGYEPYCPYTANPGSNGEGSWTGPDLERAQRLVRRSGTSGMSIAFEYIDDWPVGPPIGEHLTEVLEELGYKVTATAVPEKEFPTNRFQMALTGWGPDYPAASTFFEQLLTCNAPSFASGFCDPEIDAMMERAKLMQLDDPVAAGALWAEIDRAIVDQAPFVWLFNPIDVVIVSDRVGNFQRNPNWGILLNQLWVR